MTETPEHRPPTTSLRRRRRATRSRRCARSWPRPRPAPAAARDAPAARHRRTRQRAPPRRARAVDRPEVRRRDASCGELLSVVRQPRAGPEGRREPRQPQAQALVEGMQLTYKQLMALLEKHGVQPGRPARPAVQPRPAPGDVDGRVGRGPAQPRRRRDAEGLHACTTACCGRRWWSWPRSPRGLKALETGRLIRWRNPRSRQFQNQI